MQPSILQLLASWLFRSSAQGALRPKERFSKGGDAFYIFPTCYLPVDDSLSTNDPISLYQVIFFSLFHMG